MIHRIERVIVHPEDAPEQVRSRRAQCCDLTKFLFFSKATKGSIVEEVPLKLAPLLKPLRSPHIFTFALLLAATISRADDAHYRSKTFRRDMDETSRTHRNIYVGSGLAELQDQPNFGDAGFDPESKEVREKPAFGKAAGAETHFIVVKPAPHSLMHDGQRFDGSAQLALA